MTHLRHLRRAMANHSECDPDDTREYADGPDDSNCDECLAAYSRRKVEWYADLAAASRLKREPVEPPAEDDKQTAPTEPGKRGAKR